LVILIVEIDFSRKSILLKKGLKKIYFIEMPKAKYTDELLQQIVTEQNITLTESYKNVKRDTKISGQCLTKDCPNTFCKPFRYLVENVGPYCIVCTQKNSKQQKNEKQYDENIKKLLTYAEEHNIYLLDRDKYNNLNKDSRISGICTECNTQSFDKTFRQLFKSGALCDDCTEDSAQEKREEKCLKLYGVTSILKDPERQKEIRENHLEETGYHIGHTPEAEEKRKESLIKSIGYDNAFKSPKIQNQILQNRDEFKKENGCDISHTPEAIEKRIATNQERFGCDHPWQNKEVQEKRRQTNQKHFGCDNPAQHPVIQKRMKLTNLRLYGVEYPMQNPKIRKRAAEAYFKKTGYHNPRQNPEVLREILKTCLERYGVEYPMQNPEVSERASKNAYKVYEYICKSGDIRYFQGYEKYGMDWLLTMFPEEDIINL
jgi:hypothetical protein